MKRKKGFEVKSSDSEAWRFPFITSFLHRLLFSSVFLGGLDSLQRWCINESPCKIRDVKTQMDGWDLEKIMRIQPYDRRGARDHSRSMTRSRLWSDLHRWIELGRDPTVEDLRGSNTYFGDFSRTTRDQWTVTVIDSVQLCLLPTCCWRNNKYYAAPNSCFPKIFFLFVPIIDK